VQTPRELVDALVRGRRAERVGLFDYPWPDTLTKWVREGYRTDDDSRPVDPGDHFGFDMRCVGGWFDLLPLRGVHELVEETDEWAIHRNGAGAALKYWKSKSGTPEHIDFRMTSREVWERDYRPHLLELDRARLDVEGTGKALAYRKGQGLWTYYGHRFVWENMRQSMGDVCMYESLVLDPEWIHDYNRVYTDFFKIHYRVLIEEAGKPDAIWLCDDLGYKNGLFCSPQVLDELIVPYYQEVIEFFNSYDLPVVLHTCGAIEQALPLIIKAGSVGLNPMEREAGNDPLKYAEQHWDKLAFFGGLDARVLESGDRELIRREVVALIEGMKARNARFVFGSDRSISTDVAYADFQFALDVYREHMAY